MPSLANWTFAAILVAAAGGLVAADDRPGTELRRDGSGKTLVITHGGTYTGSWRSDDPDIPAVTIRTAEPVVLQDCEISGVGTLVSTRYGPPSDAPDGVNPLNQDDADITVRNCRAVGLRPEDADRAMPRFIVARNARKVIVEHNSIEGTRGIAVDATPGRTGPAALVVRYNTASNVDGRCAAECSPERNISGWVSEAGIAVANFLQLANLALPAGAEITRNLVRNEPGNSAVEDVISLFNVSAPEGRRIVVADNFLDGAFPGVEPESGEFSGSGIMVDGNRDVEAPPSAGIEIRQNRVLYASNAGIGIAFGHGNRAHGNIVVRPRTYGGGRVLQGRAVGIYVWNCYGVPAREFAGNLAYGNSLYVESFQDGGFVENNVWLPDCEADAKGDGCDNDELNFDGEPAEIAQRLLAEWLERIRADGRQPGASPRPDHAPTAPN